MAPSTPPPPSSDWLAALTMASTESVVMSATQISSCVVPTVAVSRSLPSFINSSVPVGALFQSVERFRRLDHDLVGIEPRQTAAVLEDPPVDHDGVDVVRLRRAHDRRD